MPIPGTNTPLPWEEGGLLNQAKPTPPPPPVDTSTRDKYLNDLAAKHGGLLGKPSPVTVKLPSSQVKNPGDPTTQATGYDLYTFADGTTVDLTPDGQFQNYKPSTASTKSAPGFTNMTPIAQPDGTKILYGTDPADGKFKPVPDAPTEAATTTPKTPADQTQTVGGVVYQPDPKNPGGPYIAVTPTEDSKAKATADLQATLTSANYTQAQIDALKLKSPAEIQQILANTSLSAAQQAQVLNNIQIANAKVGGEIAATAASTAESQARTGQIASAVDIAGQKAPGEIAYTAAQTEAQRQAALTSAQSRQIAGQPTVTQPGTTPYISTINPLTGQVDQSQMNLAFQPKTQADVAARVGQLQQSAQAQKDLLAKQVSSGALSKDQAAQQFDDWWSKTVEPQKGVLEAAQRQAAAEEQRAAQEQQRSNLATAQSAGQTAVTGQTALMPYMVGPGFGQMLGKMAGGWSNPGGPGLSPQDIASGVMFKAPDMNQVYQNATAQALAHISPTASAMANGSPNPSMTQQPIDITQQLNRMNYGGPSAPPGAVGAVGAAQPVPVAAGGPALGMPGNLLTGLAQGTGPYGPGQFQPTTYGPFNGAMPPYQPSF